MSAFGGKAEIAHADQARRIAANIAKLPELLLSRKFKRNHVSAICDDCHRLTLADFGNTSHVREQVRARTRMMSNVFLHTRLLVFLAVTGGLATAIVLSLSGELIAHLFG